MEELSPEKRRISKEEEANLQISTPPKIDQRSSQTVHGGITNVVMRSICVVMVSVLLVFTMYYMRDYIHAVLLWTELQPPYTVFIIFVALYTLVSLPVVWGYIVINLACGYVYGLLHGIAVTVITATIGVIIAHILCKHVLASHIKSLLQQTEYVRSLLSVISGQQAFKLVVLARLTPIPFGLQNAVFSVSSLSTERYILASVLGLLPTQTLNIYIGSTLRSMEEVVTNSDHMMTGWVILIIQLLITLMVGVFIVRKARLELDRTIHAGSADPEAGVSKLEVKEVV